MKLIEKSMKLIESRGSASRDTEARLGARRRRASRYPVFQERQKAADVDRKTTPEMAKSGTNGSRKGQFGRIRPENGIPGQTGSVRTGFAA